MTPPTMLQSGDVVPHFEVKTTSGEVFCYVTTWQRRNLVLVVVPGTDDDDTYVSALLARRGEFRARRSECIITTDDVPGLHAPAVLVADRWGEIVHLATSSLVSRLPAPEDLLDWLDYLEKRCPECEGEAR